MTPDRRQLADRAAVVRRDIDELATQVEEGEIDPGTAEELRTAYHQELDALAAALEDLAPADSEDRASESAAADTAPMIGRSPGRMVAGSLVVLAALSLIVFFAARDTREEPAAAEPVPGQLSIDPASVSNDELETVVAANPEITGMRMALADRYFEAEQFGASLNHYLYIAENSQDERAKSKALVRIGWMAYISGEPQAADEYMDAGLAIFPANSEAIFYRGFITLYGLDDPGAAIPQLEAALELPDLPEDLVWQVDEALQDARDGSVP